MVTETTTRRKIHTPLVVTAPSMPVKAQIDYGGHVQILLTDDRYLSVSGVWVGIPKDLREQAKGLLKLVPPVEMSFRTGSHIKEYQALGVAVNKAGKSALIMAGTVPVLMVLVDPACLVVEEPIPDPQSVKYEVKEG